MQVTTDKWGQLRQTILINSSIFLAYLFLAILLFGIGMDLTNRALGHGDTWTVGVPMSIFSRSLSMWNPYLQSGTFAFKDIGFQSLYLPGILLMKILPTITGYNTLLFLHYALAGSFTFFFLRELGLNWISSFTGGLIFIFSGFMVAHQNHNAMFMAASYLPVVLYFVERYMNSESVKFLFLGAITFALSILADYIASTMYIGMITFPYILFRSLIKPGRDAASLRSKTISIFKCSFVIFGLGIALAAFQILPIAEALRNVTREKISYDFFASFSFSFKLLPILIFPYIYGASNSSLYHSMYFGPWNLTEMAGYMGILPVLFAILAISLFIKQNKQIFFWMVVAVLGFVLVLGNSTPIYKLMYHVPVYNMFRASARNWLEVNFAIAVLSSFFVHYMMVNPVLQKGKYLNSVHLCVAILLSAVLFILAAGRKFIPTPEILENWIATSSITAPEVYIPLLVILVSIVLLYGLYWYRNRMTYWGLVIAFVFLDLFFFGHFFHTSVPPYKALQHKTNSLDEFLTAQGGDKSQYRIWGLNPDDPDNQIYTNINLLYGLQSVAAYSNMWLKDYQDMTTFEVKGVSRSKYQLLKNSKILSTLATRYIITSLPEDKEFMQRLFAGENTKRTSTIVDGFSDPAWQFISPVRINKDVATLKLLKDGVSLIQVPFAIQPRTFYRVNFKAKMSGRLPDSALTVDFAGEGYDNHEQEASFNSLSHNDYYTRASLSREYQDLSVDFYSGEVVPDSAFLRFYTWSKAPYQIRDVKLMEIDGTAPRLDPGREIMGRPANLYIKKFESPEGIAVYENTNFLPRARFVENVIHVKDASSATDIFWNDPDFDPTRTATVESFSGSTTFEKGEVISADYSNNNKVVLSVNTGERSFLVLADTWYPGWKAYIDGRETPIYKTNAVSRGVIIEGEGQHTVRFVFSPGSFYLGLAVACLVLIGMLVYTFIEEKFKRASQNTLVR